MRVQPPSFPYGAELHDGREELSVEDLCDAGLKALEDLVKEVDRLNKHLPRKFDDRIRALRGPSTVVAECLRGSRDKAKLSRLCLEGGKR